MQKKLLLLLLAVLLGCSTATSVIRKAGIARPAALKKRALFLPLIDRTDLGADKTAQLNAYFIETLKKSPYILLYDKPEGPSFQTGEISPELGVIAPSNLIEKAKGLGINALITGLLNPIDTATKKTGIWPFRKVCRVYKISIIVNVVDTTSRTVLSTHIESDQVLVPLRDAPDKTQKNLLYDALKNTFFRTLKRHASDVIETLRQTAWTGRIMAIDNTSNTIKINAGKDVGVSIEQRFEVFALGDSVSSANGKTFDLLGRKVGEIEVKSTMEKCSLASPVTEGPYLAGQVIKFVR